MFEMHWLMKEKGGGRGVGEVVEREPDVDKSYIINKR